MSFVGVPAMVLRELRSGWGFGVSGFAARLKACPSGFQTQCRLNVQLVLTGLGPAFWKLITWVGFAIGYGFERAGQTIRGCTDRSAAKELVCAFVGIQMSSDRSRDPLFERDTSNTRLYLSGTSDGVWQRDGTHVGHSGNLSRMIAPGVMTRIPKRCSAT